MSKLRIGLTGGIGSGKSTVSDFLQQWGASIIDADQLSRQATQAGGIAVPAIARRFGEQFITSEGAMDRQAMRQLVFSDASAMQHLEAIIHPLVQQQMRELAQQADGLYIVFDIPLLIESVEHYRPLLDRICVVDCEQSTQILRVQRRGGLSAEMVNQIIAKQASRVQRLACADDVIENLARTSLAQLREDCLEKHLAWLSLVPQESH